MDRRSIKRDDRTPEEIELDNFAPRRRSRTAVKSDIFIPNTISVADLAVTMTVPLRQSREPPLPLDADVVSDASF